MFFIIIYILYLYFNIVSPLDLLDQLLISPRNANQSVGTTTSCFGTLGCLSTTEEWFHRTYRPHNLEPLDRHTIKTEFNVITKSKSTSNVLNLDFTHIKNGTELNGISTNSKIIILIHDFTSNGFTGWIKHMAAAYLINEDVTVISVDWQAGAEPPFEQAIANARVVALEIIALLNNTGVQKKDSSCSSSSTSSSSSSLTSSICLIGHGVGAHIAGYVGHSYNVSKIYGLDPTGPYFENMPPIVRLDSTDAQWVEVIHTDAHSARSQGTLTIMGHIDFFVNGANLQPRCNESSHMSKFTKLDRNSLKEGAILPACSHKRSFKYFIEAIQIQECEFIGFECGNYKDFLEGKCTKCISEKETTCAKIGAKERSTKKDGASYYLKTSESSPFCMNPYKIQVYFDEKSHGKSDRTGNFEVIMIGENGTVANAHESSESPITFRVSEPFAMIYYAKPPIAVELVELRLKWINNPNSLCLFCNNAVYVRKVNVQFISISEPKKYKKCKMCPTQGVIEIKSGASVSFYKCNDSGVSKKPLNQNV